MADAYQNSGSPPAAPGPAGQAPAGTAAPTADVLHDIKQLADRVGGLGQLRDLIDELAGMRRG